MSYMTAVRENGKVQPYILKLSMGLFIILKSIIKKPISLLLLFEEIMKLLSRHFR